MKNIAKHKKYAFLFALVILLAFSAVKFTGLADTPASDGNPMRFRRDFLRDNLQVHST